MTALWICLGVLAAILVGAGVGWLVFAYMITKVFDDWFV